MTAFPHTRGECLCYARPCPFIQCRHHLHSDVHWTGKQWKFRLSRTQGTDTCSLDVAEKAANFDDGIMPMEEIGKAMGMTREAVRQLLFKTLADVYRRLTVWDVIQRELRFGPDEDEETCLDDEAGG